jgi:hypothetical protein
MSSTLTALPPADLPLLLSTPIYVVQGGDSKQAALGDLLAASANSQQAFTGNGATAVFTLASAPANGKAIVTINGLVQTPTTDYSISGATLTFVTAPIVASDITVFFSAPSGGSTLPDQTAHAGEYLSTDGSIASWAAAVGGSGEMLSASAAPIAITGAATLTIGRWHICTGTTADYTATLPAASGNANKFLGIIMGLPAALTKFITVDGNGAELIDGQAARIMWANEVAVLRCDGTGWTKLAGKSVALSCTMRRNSNQTIPALTETKVLLNQIDLDPSGAMGDVPNSQIIIKRSGTYTAPGQTFWLALAANEPLISSKLFLNGALLNDANFSGLLTAYCTVPMTVKPFQFAVGDALSLWAYCQGSEAIYGSSTAASFISLIEQALW